MTQNVPDYVPEGIRVNTPKNNFICTLIDVLCSNVSKWNLPGCLAIPDMVKNLIHMTVEFCSAKKKNKITTLQAKWK